MESEKIKNKSFFFFKLLQQFSCFDSHGHGRVVPTAADKEAFLGAGNTKWDWRNFEHLQRSFRGKPRPVKPSWAGGGGGGRRRRRRLLTSLGPRCLLLTLEYRLFTHIQLGCECKKKRSCQLVPFIVVAKILFIAGVGYHLRLYRPRLKYIYILRLIPFCCYILTTHSL